MAEYLDAFFSGLYNILPLSDHGTDAFKAMMLGVSIGFVVGILPGLGGAVTLALMLPFTFDMDATQAFAFLLGANAVTATTGDLTSILFGVPGEGISAAVIVDGHPMAKRGEAGRAMGAALMSSLVGAVLGALVLAMAIPMIRPIVLSIASPEFFMLALLGISFVAALAGSNMIKGLTIGAFGLALAMIGLDPIQGIPRYTMDAAIGTKESLFLWDGINFIAITVGLFAIPEIIDLAVKGTGISTRAAGKLGGVMQGVKDTFIHWWLVFRCSALGAYIGIVPGLGGGPAQWMSYAHAVQTSPDKESFGKGRVEGVLGPGAANNSKEGGSLIPTIAFGIPGSLSMAILLGAFIIQGLVPGPRLLSPTELIRPDIESLGGGFVPTGLEFTFSLVWILIVANVITVAVSFLFLRHLARITEIRGALLIPFILLLVYLGGFTVANRSQDLALVVVFGALGWVMMKYDWPRPPLLLGIVLGRLAENRLFISTQVHGDFGWMARPGVIIIALIIFASLAFPMWQDRKARKREEQGPVAALRETQGLQIRGFRLGPVIAGAVVGLMILFWFALVEKMLVSYSEISPRAIITGAFVGLALAGLTAAAVAKGRELASAVLASVVILAISVPANLALGASLNGGHVLLLILGGMAFGTLGGGLIYLARRYPLMKSLQEVVPGRRPGGPVAQPGGDGADGDS